MSTSRTIPSWINMVFLTLLVAATIPPWLIIRARYNHSNQTRIHPIPDMDFTPAYRPLTANPVFADGRAMRLPVPGTVAQGELHEDDHFHRGKVGGEWAKEFPMAVDMDLLERGRERYEIFCSPCHGLDGYGDGPVAIRAAIVAEATWTTPTSLHKTGEDTPTSQPVGKLFNTITNGIRNMPPYGPQIPEHDRWAIIAYVRALQRSQNAKPGD